MSRSYKHSGWIQDRSGKKFGKRLANRRVRRCSEVSNGKSYRKVFESWNISDYVLPARGVIKFKELRPGRKFKKLNKGTVRDNWWWLFDESDKDKMYKDWIK